MTEGIKAPGSLQAAKVYITKLFIQKWIVEELVDPTLVTPLDYLMDCLNPSMIKVLIWPKLIN